MQCMHVVDVYDRKRILVLMTSRWEPADVKATCGFRLCTTTSHSAIRSIHTRTWRSFVDAPSHGC